MKHFLIIIASVLLVGCIDPYAGKAWRKAGGGGLENSQADQYDCKAKVYTMMGGSANMNAGHYFLLESEIQNCMRSKGYSLEPIQTPVQANPYDSQAWKDIPVSKSVRD